MQESPSPSTKSRRKRRTKRPRGVVLLISTNPLALPELRRLVRHSGMRSRPCYVKPASLAEVDDVRVPRAAIFVVDGFSTGAVTEKLVAALRTQHPRAAVIVLVNGMTDAQGFALLQLGVKGIVPLRDLADSLGKVIAFVATGGVRMPRGLMGRFLDTNSGASPLLPSPRLSHRERQVLDGVVKSRSNKEIADDLHISESTVKFHLARVFRKFRVRRRAELIVQSAHETLVH